MRRARSGLLLVALLTLASTLAGAHPAQADDPPSPNSSSSAVDPFAAREDQLAVLVDRARAAAGLLPIARAAALDRAAIAHANDMVAQGYMDHDAPDGSTPASRAADAGYQTPRGGPWLVVEVISARGDQPQDALDWWLSDGVHRRVVLRSTWREMGVGFAPGGPYGRFWVMEFACRPDVLPPVLLDGTLTIPDETCGRTGGSFGPVQSIRVAENTDQLPKADWQPYTPQQPWPTGKPVVVELRDAQDRQLDAPAHDPRGNPTESP